MSLFLFIEYRISMVFLLAFLLLFLPLQSSKGKVTASVVLCFLFTGVSDGIGFFFTSNLYLTLPVTFFEIFMVQLTGIYICKYRDFRALFTGISSSAYVLAGNVCGILVYIVSGSYVTAIIAQSITHFLLLLFLVLQMRDKYKEELEERTSGWGTLCLIPSLCYAAVVALVSWPGNLYKIPQNALGVLMVLMLMATSYILIIRLRSKERQENVLMHNNEMLTMYAGRLKHEAEILQEAEAQTVILRHDMRHTASLISAYLKEGETEKIRELLLEWNGRLDAIKARRYCENVALNGVLSEYAQKAEQKQISFVTAVDLPKQISVNEFEFATVVANLLENAVQAAAEVSKQENRRVRIQAEQHKGQAIIEISNTFQGPCELSQKTGFPVSKRGPGHGYGLRSVQVFAKKYGALFDITIQEDVFQVRLLVGCGM